MSNPTQIPKSFNEKYDSILKQTGGFGPFHRLIISGFICSMLSASWYLYGLTYYELMPEEF
jgi:hypothetical protein